MGTFTPPPAYPEFSREKSSIPKWLIFLGFVVVFIIVSISIWFFLFKNKITENKNLTSEISTTTSLLEIADWKTYINDGFGYKLQYPPDWIIENGIIVSPDKKSRFNTIMTTCSSYESFGEFEYQPFSTTTGRFVKDVCRIGMTVSLSVLGTTNEELGKYQKTLEKILSTMKLAVDISAWKTYQNKDFLFEFKYPEGFRLNKDEYPSFINIYLEMLEVAPNKSDISQTEDRWSPTNFFISAKKTSETTDSIKNNIENKGWQPFKFQNRDALLIGADDYCNKKIVFVEKGVKYEITQPTNCDIPLDNRITKIYETFRVIDLDTESLSDVTSGETYINKQYGFEFQYPTEWKLREGPITFNIVPSMIVVRYTPENRAPKIKCAQDDSLFICTEIKLAGDKNLKAYIYLQKSETFFDGGRLLPKNGYFQDYANIIDGNGNIISIDFFSKMQQEEVSRSIKAVLSTFKFTG